MDHRARAKRSRAPDRAVQPPPTLHLRRGRVQPQGNLLKRTRALRDAGRITGWFWGHEHKLITYGAHAGIGYATCMGHGAILEVPAVHPHPGEFDGKFTDPDGPTWRMPGFAVIDLDGATMRVRYQDKNGQTWGPGETIPALP